MTYSRVAWLVLIPAIAIAAPKKKKSKTVEKPADTSATGSGSDSSSSDKPADTADTTKDTAKPDDKATKSLLSGGTVGGGAGGAGSGAGGGGGAGAGSGSAADAAPAATNEPDVDSLRQEYLSLRDELLKSRARANAVASQLYSTRVTIKFTWTSARYYGVSKASVRLDGATVFEDATIGNDDGVRFDGYVAPGRHLVTFHVEATGKDDDSFTSSTESQIVVKAIAGKDLLVSGKAHDSGDIAYEWKHSSHGTYGLGIDVAVKAVAAAAADAAGPTKGVKK